MGRDVFYMKKKLIALAMSAAVLATSIFPVFAEDGVSRTKVYFGGTEIEGAYATFYEGTAATVSVRAVFEAMGCTVEWIPNGDPSIEIHKDGQKILAFNVGDDFVPAVVGGEETEIMLMSPVYVDEAAGWVTVINAYAVANVLDMPIFIEGESDPATIDAMFHYDAEGNVYFPAMEAAQ